MIKTPLRSLELSDQHFLETSFHAMGLSFSEYSFANLYLFRNIHNYQIILLGDRYFIQGTNRKKENYLMPTSPPTDWNSKTFELLINSRLCLYPIPKEWEEHFTSYNYSLNFDDAESDYLLSVERMAAYDDKYLKKKQNQANKLLNDAYVETFTLEKTLKEQALEVVEKWQTESGRSKSETDYESTREAIELLNCLDLQGVLYVVNGRPEGLLIGEKINSEIFCLHFSKANKALYGLNQYMLHHFAELLQRSNFCWLNLEQDLGLAPLRQSKRSYHPDVLLHKYCLHFGE